MKMTNRLKRAAEFVKKAHGGQVRTGSGAPYFVHLQEVAELVALVYPKDENLIIAAYGHDTIEDTCKPDNKPGFVVNYDMLVVVFNMDVADLILGATDVYTHEAFPQLRRPARKRQEAERKATLGTRGQTLALADMISNTRSIVRDDKSFAPTYLDEKAYLLPLLTRAHEDLRVLARKELAAAKRRLA